MPWWGWLALGAALLGAEIAVQTEFWLATIGAAAMVMGLGLTLIDDPRIWVQWIAFAVLAVAFNLLFRRQLHEKLIGQRARARARARRRVGCGARGDRAGRAGARGAARLHLAGAQRGNRVGRGARARARDGRARNPARSPGLVERRARMETLIGVGVVVALVVFVIFRPRSWCRSRTPT